MFNGEIYYNDGKTIHYTGSFTFDSGRLSGKGIEYENNPSNIVLKYDGYFSKSVYDYNGKLYEGGILIYDGHFEKGHRHGVGKEYAADGSEKFVRYINGEKE